MWKVAPFYYFHCVVSYIRLLSAIPNSKTIAKLNVIILFSDVKHETLKAIATQTSFSSVELTLSSVAFPILSAVVVMLLPLSSHK